MIAMPSITHSHSLTFENVSLVRGDNNLFDNLNFSLTNNQLLWLQGGNGTGKTSILKLASGISSPNAGEISWEFNQSECGPETLIAYQGHNPGLEPSFKAFEELEFWEDVYESDIPMEDVIRITQIEPFLKTQCSKLSAGQKRRLVLARLLLSDRPIWLLDEPKAAMDQDGQGLVDELIKQRLRSGGSVMVATHQAPSALGTQTRRLILEAS